MMTRLSGPVLRWSVHDRSAIALTAILVVSLIHTRIAASPEPPQAGAEAQAQLRHARELSAAFREASRRVAPAVVNITTQATVTASRPAQPDGSTDPRFRSPFEDEFFRRFFGDDFRGFEFRVPEPQDRTLRGQGSGVIIDRQGHIVTNNHVVASAGEITVTLVGGRDYDATVVGTDPETDLAVLKIVNPDTPDTPDLAPATFGDSESLEVGEWVLAVGTPFGLDHTVTAGIVSATGRQMGIASYESFIQTDAAINPGNSGGPLINLNGEVIGINTAITTRTGTNSGIGFAIPAHMVRSVVASLIEGGKVHRGWLGVLVQELEPALARSFDYWSDGGVVIARVEPDTPAAAAGLQDGDIIMTLNGKAVHQPNDVRNAVAAAKPGSELELRIFRDGEQRTVDVEIGERPPVAVLAQRGSRAPEPADELGIVIEPLAPQAARELGLSGENGVIVSRVAPGSLADRAGIEPGDVILRIGDSMVRSPADVRSALARADLARGVRLQLRRGELTRFVVIRSNG